MTAEAFPLEWPHGWPRTRRRTEPKYKVGYQQAMDEMLRELKLLGASVIVVSTNVPVRQDGLPYADYVRRRIDDPGVAVYFKRKGEPQVIACDAWERVQHNIRAIGLTVAGLRAVQRAGASELLNRAFTGFKALPANASPSSTRTWREVLGVSSGATIDYAKKRYRKLAAENHPDKAGADVAMVALNLAWEQAKSELGAS